MIRRLFHYNIHDIKFPKAYWGKLIAGFLPSVLKDQLFLAELEKKMLREKQVEIPTDHFFSGGVYIKSIFVPAGTLVIGKRHRYESCNMLLQGKMSLFVGRGKPPKKISAPYIFSSKPYVKKLGYAHTDVIFSNVFPTEERDTDEIEDDVTIKEEEFIDLIEGEYKELQLCQW